MLMPSIFGENLFDDSWMDFPVLDKEFFNKKSPLYGKNAKNMMKTDIRRRMAHMSWMSICRDSRPMRSVQRLKMVI